MNLRRLTLLAAIVLTLALARGAAADMDADLYVVKPLANGTVTITVSANGATQTTTANILATDSEATKRRKIRDALEKNGYCTRTISDRRGTAIWISGLPNGARVTFDPGGTGESRDQLYAPSSLKYLSGFRGSFSSLGGDGGPASFTAGVATSRGGALVTLLADEIASGGGSVPGSLVAARLHDALAPIAGSLGATLTLAGEEIAVDFDDPADPEKSVSFGTTSTSEGVSASVELAAQPFFGPGCDDPLTCGTDQACAAVPDLEPSPAPEPDHPAPPPPPLPDPTPTSDHPAPPAPPDTEPTTTTAPAPDGEPEPDLPGGEETDGNQVAKVCVWSCQYNPNFGTWKYWFAPNLSSCPVTKCQPRNGNSPSGTVCNQGDPDIPGTCVP